MKLKIFLLGLLFSFIIDSNTFAASDDDSSSLDENDKSSIENKNFSKRPYLRDILSEFSDPENERPVWFNELFGLRGDNDIVLDTQTLNEKIEINEEVFKNVTTEIDQTILIENNKDQHITPNLINDVDSEEDFFFNNAAIQNLLNQIENDVDFLVELASEDREDVFVVDSKSNFYKEALKHINEVIPKNLLFEKEDKKYWEKIVKDLKNKVDPENKNTFCSLRAFFLFLQRKPSFFS